VSAFLLAAFSCPAVAKAADSPAAPLVVVPAFPEVASQGSANYYVPIIRPPPTAGVGPALELGYHSERGTGLAGVGWSLDWTDSSVTGVTLHYLLQYAGVIRCSNANAGGSKADRVSGGAKDGLCLNGERLIAVKGAYGAPESEYRTEIDSFQKIIAHGRLLDGPAWFEVHTKHGAIVEYGNSDDSRLLSDRKDMVHAWLVAKTSDVVNNYVAYAYKLDPISGRPYPVRLDYTGNDKANLQPYNSIRLSYSSRPAAPPLLAHILTYAGDQLVLDYRLAYDHPESDRVHLTGVQLCSATGSCLPPTTMHWGGSTGDLLTAVDNGIGAIHGFEYRGFDPSFATASTDREVNGQAVIQLCARSTESDGHDPVHAIDYSYFEPKFDPEEGRFLGFGRTEIVDRTSGRREENVWRQDFPYRGVLESTTASYGPVVVESVANTYDAEKLGGGRYLIALREKVERSSDLDGTPMPSKTTSYKYNADGDETERIEVSENAKIITRKWYANDERLWHLGRMSRLVQQRTVEGSSITRTAAFAYDPDSGLLAQEVSEPDKNEFWRRTDYGHDVFGDTVSELKTGADIEPRKRRILFDSKDRFELEEDDPAGNRESWTHEELFGNETGHFENGKRLSERTSDGFGRTSSEADARRRIEYRYPYCKGVYDGSEPCPEGAAFFVRKDFAAHATGSGMTETAYYDPFARIVASETRTSSDVVRVARGYDASGNLARESEPFDPQHGAPTWTITSHDAFGRTVDIDRPDGSSAHHTYHGSRTEVVDDGRRTIVIKNAQGLRATEIGPDGQSTAYRYDSYGDLLQVSDKDGITVNTYDIRGNLLSTRGPHGNKTYKYNVLGEQMSDTAAVPDSHP